ncbi:hypothetical protein [Caproiciproducens galactitolivorans]|uniref:Uncharacterized protein n=1 Tax=Caproiciproducens galactitolivorans TaxID=642589 RepID=A0ABT4BVP3_9FIRM|nr:hypothetical protein [Caproiciproducens galactitolivorans]MCY1714959.1 hypothetical protein [Caproiciproducens galactitolivorans]
MAENYNYDMQRLQQDAIRRAREMQSRAQAAASQPNRNMPNPAVPNPPTHPARHSAPPPQRAAVPPPIPEGNRENRPANEPAKGQIGPIQNIFDILFNDSERTLILILVLLLIEEQADTGLIFSLLYLIL